MSKWLRLTLRMQAASPPLFPPSLWNVHESTLARRSRTNNPSEAHNRGFGALTTTNGSMWKLIESMKADYACTRKDIMKEMMGDMGEEPIPKTDIKREKRIHRLCRRVATGRKSVSMFLSGIGRNIFFQSPLIEISHKT